MLSLPVSRPYRAERGAIVVETAIVTAAILAMVLGAIQLGLLGFLQITFDAGAFLNAHYNALGSSGASTTFTSSQAATATNAVLHQIPVPAISPPVVLAAPSPTVPVDYSYNDPNAATRAAAANARHGGASIMQPYLQQTNISETPFSFLGKPFHVTSQATEAVWLETGQEYDVAGINYGSPYSSANPAVSNANYFNQGENTPLYYLSFNFVSHCTTGGTWSGANCPNTDYLALGMAEHLEVYNWGNPVPGVSGPANSTGAGGSTGVFEQMACHQRMYSTIASFFLAAQSAGPTAFANLQTNYNPYYYNNHFNGYSNFANASFFKYQAGTYNASTGTAATVANYIQDIYSWDVERGSNAPLGTAPGQYPLTPGVGCT